MATSITRSLLRTRCGATSSFAAVIRQQQSASANSSRQSLSQALFQQRRGLATPAEQQPRLRIGAAAPNFKAKTTIGEIDFHEWKKGSWTVLFSHPADFTPVCTTELGAFAKFKDEWEAKNIKMIGLSTDDLGSHDKWFSDIKDVTSNTVTFPLISDTDRRVAWLYDMISEEELSKTNAQGLAMTIRSVFIIDPNNKIRLSMQYPASTGRNTAEVARVLEALQTHEKHSVNTPIDWTRGQDVIVPPAVSTEDAKKKFGEVREDKPYLRWVKVKE